MKAKRIRRNLSLTARLSVNEAAEIAKDPRRSFILTWDGAMRLLLSVPEDCRAEAEVCRFDVYYDRLETQEEADLRERRKLEKEAQVRQEELAQLEKLQKKYGRQNA